MAGRAALNIANTNETYFFKGDKYVKIHWKPGTTNEDISHGPTEFANEWKALKQAGFSQIDAILPVPTHDHRAYFFSGTKYVRVEYDPASLDTSKIVGHVKEITAANGWYSLAKIGFNHIDGALMVPGRKDEVYFFSGEQYCRVRFSEAVGNQLLDGPKQITAGWASMGFNEIDTIIPCPGSERGAYVFSKDKYALINVVPGGRDELVSGPRGAAPYWPSLKKADFY